jgi:hypothetical protein
MASAGAQISILSRKNNKLMCVIAIFIYQQLVKKPQEIKRKPY